MFTIRIARFGSQILVSVSLLSLSFLLFYTMNNNVALYTNTRHGSITNRQEEKPSETQDHTANIVKQITSVSKKGSPVKISMTVSNLAEKDVSKTVPEEEQTRNKTRYLVYLCDKHRSCGGWGDRQRGMVAASVLAIVTGRKFGLNMSYPCDIKLFYIPNEINWYVKTTEIRGLSWEIVDWMDNRHQSVDCESDFNKLHPSDIVFLKSNQDVTYRLTRSPRYGHLVPDEYRNRQTSFHVGWHKLMKPSIHFEEHIDMFMTKVPDKGDLVCAHVRMRQNPTIPNDGKQINSLSSVDSLWTFLSKYEKNASRIFIATDSMDVRKSARKHLGSKELDTDGLVLHIDRQGRWSEACLGFEMVLLEQAVLTKCKVLVKSASGFSARAAMMSTIKQKYFIFRNGTIS